MGKKSKKYKTFELTKCDIEVSCNNCSFSEEPETPEDVVKTMHHHNSQTNHTEFDVQELMSIKLGRIKVKS